MNQQEQLKYFFICSSSWDWHQTQEYKFPYTQEHMFILKLIPSLTILCTFHYTLPDVGRFKNLSLWVCHINISTNTHQAACREIFCQACTYSDLCTSLNSTDESQVQFANWATRSWQELQQQLISFNWTSHIKILEWLHHSLKSKLCFAEVAFNQILVDFITKSVLVW